MNFKAYNRTCKVLDYLPSKYFELDASVQITDKFNGTLTIDECGIRTVEISDKVQIEVLTREFQYIKFKPWIKLSDAINEARNLGYKGLIVAENRFYVVHPRLFNMKSDILERGRLYNAVNNGSSTKNGLAKTFEDEQFQATIDKIQKAQNASQGVKANKSKGIKQLQTFNARYTDIHNIVKGR